MRVYEPYFYGIASNDVMPSLGPTLCVVVPVSEEGPRSSEGGITSAEGDGFHVFLIEKEAYI